MKKNIAIFASGNGTNAVNLIQYFYNHPQIAVALVVTNKADAGVIEKAKDYKVPVSIFTNSEIETADSLIYLMKDYKADLIVLAGFLRKISPKIIEQWPNRIINIHPSLLPKFGGKGMYGNSVHKAVLDAGETTSGISIHLVNEDYDKGEILSQVELAIDQEETTDSLAQKIHELEYQHLPVVVENYALKTLF